MAAKNKASGGRRRRSPLRKLLGLIALGLAIAALVDQLRRPADERTWNGKVLDIVPYDFRKPTMDRFRARVWNPDGPLITPRVFGVGWGVNVGGAVARLKKAGASADSGPVAATR